MGGTAGYPVRQPGTVGLPAPRPRPLQYLPRPPAPPFASSSFLLLHESSRNARHPCSIIPFPWHPSPYPLYLCTRHSPPPATRVDHLFWSLFDCSSFLSCAALLNPLLMCSHWFISYSLVTCNVIFGVNCDFTAWQHTFGLCEHLSRGLSSPLKSSQLCHDCPASLVTGDYPRTLPRSL